MTDTSIPLHPERDKVLSGSALRRAEGEREGEEHPLAG